MTPEEKIEALSQAIHKIANTMCDVEALAEACILTAEPVAYLRPMETAPRDGQEILVVGVRGFGYLISHNGLFWVYDNGGRVTMLDHSHFKGWMPIPTA